MSKKKNAPLEIFAESLKLYFSNFDKFVKYMTFPVLGQILCLTLVLVLSYFYALNLPNLIEKFPAFKSFETSFIFAILITLPGLAIFTKAFGEYLVAYGAINSMLENMLKSGKVYDFDAHTELIKRRTIPFVGLWFLFGLFSVVALVPFFWVPCAVFAVYFILVFQVFTFEPELTPVGCVKKSLILIKGNFAKTFLLMTLVGTLTYIILPQIAMAFCDYTHITVALSGVLKPFVMLLPINQLNNFLSYIYISPLTVEKISLFTAAIFITQILVQYTLPVRTILWGLWYRKLEGSLHKITENKKTKAKRPSEKLMEQSNKKFSYKKSVTKKIDRNILRRAMEKEE